MLPTKRCGRCKETKCVTDFSFNRAQRDGYAGYCRKCVSETRTSRSSQVRRTEHRIEKYGLYPSLTQLILKSQNYKCPGCGRSITEAICETDHDHKTDKVRGFTCKDGCNQAMGNTEDNVKTLRNLANYLESGHFALQSYQPMYGDGI